MIDVKIRELLVPREGVHGEGSVARVHVLNHLFRCLISDDHQEGAKGFSISDDHLGRRINYQLHRDFACVRVGFFTRRVDDLCAVTFCVLERRHHSVVSTLIDHGCVVIAIDRRDIGF